MTSEVGIGIDVAKDKIDIASSDGQLVRVVPRTAESLRALAAELSRWNVHRVVLEASGGYERLVLEVLHAAGLPLVLVEPRRARSLAKGLGRKAKTDAIDAGVLAWMARHAVEDDALWVPRSEAKEGLRGLVVRRRQLVDAIDAEVKRHKAARTSPTRDSIDRTLAFLREEKREVEKNINAAVAEADELRGAVGILEDVRGVGRVTATTLLATVPELGTLSRSPMAALVGVAPYNRDSGKSSGPRYIHGGRAFARKVLYMAAVAAIRHRSSPLRALYARLRERGKPAKVAIVACMRKLLIHLNSVMRMHLAAAPSAAA